MTSYKSCIIWDWYLLWKLGMTGAEKAKAAANFIPTTVVSHFQICDYFRFLHSFMIAFTHSCCWSGREGIVRRSLEVGIDSEGDPHRYWVCHEWGVYIISYHSIKLLWLNLKLSRCLNKVVEFARNDLNGCRSTPTPGLEKPLPRLLPTNLICRVAAQQLFAFYNS